MFENAGTKARIVGIVMFILQVLLAAIMFFVMIAAKMVLAGIIYAALLVLSGWISAITIIAVGDAAEYSQQAAGLAFQVLHKLEKLYPSETPVTTQREMPSHPSAAAYTHQDIPAWKRVELEKQKNDQQ